MSEIRINHSDELSAQHRLENYTNWTESSPGNREDCDFIVRTANELFGPGTHWIEEREASNNAGAWVSKFGPVPMQTADARALSSPSLPGTSGPRRVDAALEQEYARYLRETHQRNGMLLMWLAVVGCCVLTITDLFRHPLPASATVLPPWLLQILLVRGLALLFSLVCIAVVCFGCAARSDIFCAAVLLCTALASGATSSLGHASDLPPADLLLLILAAFLPVGLAFRQSMALAFAMAFASSTPGLFFLSNEELSRHSNFLVVLVLTAGFAGIVCALELVPPAGDTSGRLSVSVGIVQVRPDEQAQSFYRRADRLLFQSKSSGRNRVAGATSS